MRLAFWASLLLLVAPAAVSGEDPTAFLGGAESGSIRVIQRVCSDDNLYVHHDGTFEGGIAWDGGGVVPPYDGAFGEAYDLGPGAVECVSIWISQDGWNQGESSDIFVWDGGVDGTPGNVLALVSGIVFEDIPVFPDGGRYDVEIPVTVSGAFTVGSWGNWPGFIPGYFWLIDSRGQADFSWTHVAEGLGYPSGWQHPNEIWWVGSHFCMGIGVHFTAGPTPSDPVTWGEVKHLFATGR